MRFYSTYYELSSVRINRKQLEAFDTYEGVIYLSRADFPYLLYVLC